MAKKRRRNELRPVRIEKYPSGATGSVMMHQGNTQVLCTASVSTDLPRWLAGKNGEPPTRGWVTAEYAMLPGSTSQRKRRGPDSRGTEIQRLIARSLRAAVDMTKMPGLLITCDCDVIVADGGTRTASITGAYVALAQALASARKEKLITSQPLIGPLAAVSVGIVDGQAYLDLDYELDVRADVDMNVVANHRGEFVEVQGTAERQAFSRSQLDELLDLAAKGIRKLMRVQRKAIG
jgi:ribonuclease PH